MGDILTKLFIKDRDNTEDGTVRSAYGKLCGIVGIVCNVILFFIKLVAGTLCGSVSVTADAVNNLSDASSSVVSLIGFKLAAKPADDEHPYGHGRYEYLSALTVAVLVLVIGVETLLSGIDKILHPTEVQFGILTASVLTISIALKLWLMCFNGRIGKKIRSGALVATSKDSRNDALSSTAVLLAAVISRISGFELDGYMGVIVACIIIISGFNLVKDSLSPLLGNAPDAELVCKVRKKIMSYPGVLGTHDLIIHDYGPGRQFASVHVEMAAEAPVLESHDVIDNIERELYRELHLYTSIHFDPVVTSDAALAEIKQYITSILSQLDCNITMHDLRTVPGLTHTNVIFDCVMPRSCKMSEAELKKYINDKVGQKYNDHFCVITIDRAFTSETY